MQPTDSLVLTLHPTVFGSHQAPPITRLRPLLVGSTHTRHWLPRLQGVVRLPATGGS
jgi:hypothetical protein